MTAIPTVPPAPLAELDFWQARPELEAIRGYALSHRASPWATLGVTLARVVAATPPSIVLPDIIGDVASLNLFVAICGPSGAGKGSAEGVGRRVLDLGDISSFAEHTPGSGQGLSHAYGHFDKRAGGVIRHASAAYLSLPEADHFVGLFGQTGSTLQPELRRAFMGEALGHLYVDPTKRIEIRAHTYRLSLVVGVQPARAAVLLDDADGGSPQRFLWLPATFEHPDMRPAEPAPINWRLPRFPAGARYVMGLARSAAETIDAAHLARARGGGDALDGHLLLTQEKVAAALALLCGEIDVHEWSWQLAEAVMDVSNETRQMIVDTLAAGAARTEEARTKRRVSTELAVEEATAARAFAAAQRQVVNHVLKDACGGCKRRCISRAIAGKYRIGLSIDEVLADSVARDYLSVNMTDETYSAGKRTP